MIVAEFQNHCENCAQPVAQSGLAAKFIMSKAMFTGEAPVLMDPRCSITQT